MIEELILKCRSVRRFDGDLIGPDILRELVELARCSASGGNLQPLKYVLACDKAKNNVIFPCLRWAGYLQDWEGPCEAERPRAYIIILHDKDISSSVGCDHGVAAQSIMLGAAERGIAGCMIGSIDRKELRKALSIEERYDICLVLALGKANETVVLEDVKADGDIKYYRGNDGIHHVPKRKLDEIILEQ